MGNLWVHTRSNIKNIRKHIFKPRTMVQNCSLILAVSTRIEYVWSWCGLDPTALQRPGECSSQGDLCDTLRKVPLLGTSTVGRQMESDDWQGLDQVTTPVPGKHRCLTAASGDMMRGGKEGCDEERERCTKRCSF